MTHHRRPDHPAEHSEAESPSVSLSRRGFFTGAGVTGLAAAASSLAVFTGDAKAAAPPDGTPEQIHVTWGDDPSNTVSVSWASPAQAVNPRVQPLRVRSSATKPTLWKTPSGRHAAIPIRDTASRSLISILAFPAAKRRSLSATITHPAPTRCLRPITNCSKPWCLQKTGSTPQLRHEISVSSSEGIVVSASSMLEAR